LMVDPVRRHDNGRPDVARGAQPVLRAWLTQIKTAHVVRRADARRKKAAWSEVPLG